MSAPEVTDKKFFSYATVATMGKPAYTAVKAYLEMFYTVGPPDVLYQYDPMVDSLAAEAAKLIHCDPHEVTYIKNTTEGINIASDALPLQPGDEVLVQGCEYPANLLPWLKKQQDGVVVTVVQAANTETSFHTLLKSITSRTKVVTLSSAQYYDGYIADIAELSSTCRQQGIFLVLDAVQTVGIRRIDVQQTPVDILVTGGQKYLRAGVGTGFLYVNKETLGKLRDTKIGIRSMSSFTEHAYTLKPSTARFQDGTQNLYGIVAMHAALKYINDTDIEEVEQKNLALLATIKAHLRERSIPFIDHGNTQGNIVSLPIANPADLVEFLKQRDVYIKAIKDVARISFIHDTPQEDIEMLAKLIREWLDTY